MNRHSVALLVHPFKNQLYPRERLKDSATACGRALAELLAKNSSLRLNVVMPGYVLESLDGLVVSELREHTKRGALEWLVSGFTEPFVSISPVWLTTANIGAGLALITELFGVKPAGFVPPFSNFEPPVVPTLRELGLTYMVVSNGILPVRFRERCGFWSTEYQGAWIVVFPSHLFHTYTAPARLGGWLDNISVITEAQEDCCGTPIIGLHYLLPLAGSRDDPFAWLRVAVRSLVRNEDRCQTVLYSAFLSENQPWGLVHVDASLEFRREQGDSVPFRDWLFSYHQAALLHRRLLEVCDEIAPSAAQRQHEHWVRELFAVQDINRFLPAPESGSQKLADRFWTYGKLIEIEKQLPDTKRLRGGQIRISDHLRAGFKSIIMANRSLRAYISHRSGGALYELDFYGRAVNLMAVCESQPLRWPHVLAAGRSPLSFVDRFLPYDAGTSEITAGAGELGDFVDGWFDYAVRKTTDGVQTVLARQGRLVQGERTYPLTMEKVFGLVRDRPQLSFAYRLENSSVATYRFRFTTEIAFALPGPAVGKGRLTCGGTTYHDFVWERLFHNNVTDFVLEDWLEGVRVNVAVHKPVTLWSVPVGNPSQGYQGTLFILSAPVELSGGAFWSLMGKVNIRAIRRR